VLRCALPTFLTLELDGPAVASTLVIPLSALRPSLEFSMWTQEMSHCVHHDVFTSVTASDESPFDTSEWENVLAVGHERYLEPLSNEARQPGSVDIPPDAYS
jgi:hypothetical protein